MSRCDNKDVCHSNIINKTIQNVIDYENNNKYKQNKKKFSGKLREEIVEAI